ncbi:hypothetical protein SEEM710_01248 [Salmonella enterica subsp. enterica serovar Montevideo str. ATCC BAA710]|nr:hypothetical protein SEEM710_01248 [Salmonella enterica subsp. enterica serovar Montevideo str. ATCC BAA710]
MMLLLAVAQPLQLNLLLVILLLLLSAVFPIRSR